MATRIARNDALIVRQVTSLTPTAANNGVYDTLINGKSAGSFTADGSATVQEIVEGLQPVLEANALGVPEYEELTFTEDNAIVAVTGPSTGKPFTIVDNSSVGAADLAVALVTAAKSPNHWIAENFSGLVLPATGDDVIISQLESTQSFKWNLAQGAVILASLDIRADSAAHIGLPERNTDGLPYYEYRETHLRIDTAVLKIGDGMGQGSGRIKLDLGTTTTCNATIYKTASQRADTDEAPVHLVGGKAANTLHVVSGDVDLAMLPGYTGEWGTIVVSNGTVRCGGGVTLGTIEVAGNGTVETRTAITTARTRDSGKIRHIGSGNIATADIQGGPLEIEATGALTITQLNGYGGKRLDLSKCDSAVTITDMDVYASSSDPFTINDPNNKLVMTNPADTPNGAQSLKIITGSGRTVKVV